MNADQLVVFDTKKREVVANLDRFPNVHGVWAVPELGRVCASATGEHKVAVVDMRTLKTMAKDGTGQLSGWNRFRSRTEASLCLRRTRKRCC